MAEVMAEVIFVENDWYAQGVRPDLEALIGPVTPAADFCQLVAEVDRLAGDATALKPVIILDPGIPGVCRLDAVHQARQLQGAGPIVVWTGARDPSFQAASLVEGAMAAVCKTQPLAALAAAVERAATGRYVCEPAQAQWFLDFLDYFDHYCHQLRTGGGGHVWTETKVAGHQPDPEWRTRLDETAAGEPLCADERWFAEVVGFIRALWLEPYLRQAVTALAVHNSRDQAAQALGKSIKTFNGYCAHLSPLLMPGRYLGADRAPGLALAAWVLTNHADCELAFPDHLL